MTSSDVGGIIFSMIIMGITIAYFVFAMAGIWKTFEKAGEPGWACIVPFMNFYKLSDAIVYDDFYWPADSGGKVAPRRKIPPSRIRRDFFAQPSKWSASWVI